MCTSQADALHALVRQLDAPWDGPDCLGQPHDAVLAQPGRVLGKPLSCPDQHSVGYLYEQHHHLLRRQALLADHRQPQAMLVTLEISLHACPPVIMLHYPLYWLLVQNKDANSHTGNLIAISVSDRWRR